MVFTIKPLVGITCYMNEEQVYLGHVYSDTILRSGGLPVAIPAIRELQDVEQLAETLDGLLLSGGEDIDPEWYGEDPIPGLGTVTPARDWSEIHLARRFLALNKPVFAICRGCQVLNAAFGGSLYQDLGSQHPSIQHAQKAPRSHRSHKITILEGTLLHSIAGTEQVKVNSFHHQAVKQEAPGFRVSSRAPDGVIESVEHPGSKFVLGVQWHPEHTALTDSLSAKLFEAFVQACSSPD